MLDIVTPRKRQNRSAGEEKEPVLVRIPTSLLEAVERMADERNMSRNALFIDLIDKGVHREEEHA